MENVVKDGAIINVSGQRHVTTAQVPNSGRVGTVVGSSVVPMETGVTAKGTFPTIVVALSAQTPGSVCCKENKAHPARGRVVLETIQKGGGDGIERDVLPDEP